MGHKKKWLKLPNPPAPGNGELEGTLDTDMASNTTSPIGDLAGINSEIFVRNYLILRAPPPLPPPK